MTTIEIAEGSDGVAHTITITQKGTDTGENLSSYSAAVMTVTSPDFKTVYDTITITLTTAASGILTYTTDPTHTLPSVPTGKKELHLKAQIKVTGSGLKDITEIFDFVITNDISA